MALILLWLVGCWRFDCDLEVTGDCEVTWSECDSKEGFGRIIVACEPDDDRVACTCERDGALRGTFPEAAGTCARLTGVLDEPDDERWLQSVARRQCSVR